MLDCAYCERPLSCAACNTPYLPPSEAEYEALSRRDAFVTCPECGGVLVCHRCKAIYDGVDGRAHDGGATGPEA